VIHLVHVIRKRNPGGSWRSLCAIARHLRELGPFRETAISLVPAGDAGGLADLARAAGVRVLDAPDRATLERELGAADLVQVEWWNNPEIYELLRSELPPMRLCLFLHVAGDVPPNVVTPELVDFADFVLAGCRHAAATPALARLSPAERAARVAVVPAATDFARLDGFAPRPHAGFNVGYVGTVDFKKMHPDFVALCARVRVPEARFVVGGRGEAVPVLARQAEALGLGDRFELRGYVEDVRSVFEILDVFGYPLGANPGSELTLQDALYAGVPPVVFPLGGIRDAVVDGVNGVVVETPEGYAAAIERLHRHPEERARLGAAARAFATAHFGGANSAAKLLPIYRRLMERPKRRRRWPARPASPAVRFVESLGAAAGEPFWASLAGADRERARAAEAEIARAHPLLRWGIGEYRSRYPDDPHLARWHRLAAGGGGSDAGGDGAAEAGIGAGAGDAAAARAALAGARRPGPDEREEDRDGRRRPATPSPGPPPPEPP
jgi:glycosyltransferase involved in cell wall biosynthesis